MIMVTMLIHHQVKDYAAWKVVFDSSSDLRTSNGEIGNQIYRDEKDANRLTVLNTWDTFENARKFSESPELKAAMDKAGVYGRPEIRFLNQI
jgi:heme-degrading monooxygenase HmoA